MPSRNELTSIIDFSVPPKADFSIAHKIDINYFQSAESSWEYWSSSPFAHFSDKAWMVNFYHGISSGIDGFKSYALPVRLVR